MKNPGTRLIKDGIEFEYLGRLDAARAYAHVLRPLINGVQNGNGYNLISTMNLRDYKVPPPKAGEAWRVHPASSARRRVVAVTDGYVIYEVFTPGATYADGSSDPSYLRVTTMDEFLMGEKVEE